MSEPKRTLQRSFKIFWALFRISALILLVLWLMHFPGDVYLRMLDYEFSMTLGFALAMLLLILGVLWLSLGVIRSILGFGTFWKQRRLRKNIIRAHSFFDHAVISFFSEDYASVQHDLARAIKYHPSREALYTTFAAVSALNSQQKDKAHELFFKLTQNSTFAFMGYFGLYHLCEESPVVLLEQARLKTDDHPWILKRLLDAYCEESHNLDALLKAQQLVHTLHEKHLFTKEQRNKSSAEVLWRQALYYQKQKDLVKATDLARQSYEIDDTLSGPAIFIAEKEPPQKAQKILLKACAHHPNPDVTTSILKCLPGTVETFHTFEAELGSHSHPEIQFLLAKLAYQAQLWGRAKQILSKIDESHYDARFYLLAAILAQK